MLRRAAISLVAVCALVFAAPNAFADSMDISFSSSSSYSGAEYPNDFEWVTTNTASWNLSTSAQISDNNCSIGEAGAT